MEKIVNEVRLNELLGQVLNDIGAAMSAPLVNIGDKNGLYKALADKPMSVAELARKTETNERYIQEWVHNQTAGKYISHDPATDKYFLSPEQAYLFADENSPFFVSGAFQVISAATKDDARIAENFKTGKGMAWGEHDRGLFEGTERFFRPNYLANLTTSWIPALDGIENKLENGMDVADIGCGHGASTIIMAKAYPKSRFTGFDYHEDSIKTAFARAKKNGVNNNIKFNRHGADSYPGRYDFITFFDCLHDLSDPANALKHAREALKTGGTCMIVEPFASDKASENMNPIGRIFYAASTLLCVPCSLAGNGPALGAQAGEGRIKEIADKAGFGSFRRVAQTPFNLIYEVRA